jgi:diadenosine tetraphosphate (Ap4A) HIT family hydrolase
MCRQDAAPSDRQVFSDDRWAAGVLDGYEVPGWIVLRVRRHAEGLEGLDAEDLRTFAVRARDLSKAIQEVTGAERTYLMMFGEAHPHTHALLVPRAPDTPLDRRSGQILRLRDEARDPDRCRLLVPLLRASYARHATTSHPDSGDTALADDPILLHERDTT